MKILLVWPNKDQIGYKPMSMALLSAVLKRHGHKVELFDTSFIDFGYVDNTEDKKKIRVFMPVDWSSYDLTKQKISIEQALIEKLNKFEPDIIAISALSDEVYIAFEVARVAKQWNSNVPVILGNKLAITEPEKTLECRDIDYLCVGEGVEALPEFIKYIEEGKDPKEIKNIAYRKTKDKKEIVITKLRPYYQDLDSLPYLDWSIFDNRHFFKPFDGKILRGGDYTIAWGCPNNCTYCINSHYRNVYGRGAGKYLRYYSVSRVVNELKYLKETWGIQLFIFHDEDFIVKPIEYLKRLSEAYHMYVNVPFACMVNAKNVTEEKIKLLKNMNCISVSIGIETGNANLRRNILKRKESVEDIIRAVKLFNSAGIRTSAFNMLGIPFETRQTIMETIEVNRQAEVRFPNTNFFFPYEGTELRKVAIDCGMFNPNSDAVFMQDKPALTLPGISKDELIALRERFVLYVKMPVVYHDYIRRSENPDEVGQKLTEKLFEIYDKCVLANKGIWKESGEAGNLKELFQIQWG